MRLLPDEGGNSWFMGSLVVQYWIDDENGLDEVKLANGQKWKKKANTPNSGWEQIEQPACGAECEQSNKEIP